MAGQYELGTTQRVDLVVRCGRDVRHTFTWNDAEGDPFTIVDARAQIRYTQGDQEVISDLKVDGYLTVVDGTAALEIPGADTQTWPPTTDAEWELELEEQGGQIDIPFYGKVRIIRGATR